MASINFIRMNGLGNDFLIYDKRNSSQSNAGSIFSKENIIRFCSRANTNTGGCDQLIVVGKNGDNGLYMQVFNSDGSEVYACGNASRCVVALDDRGFSGKEITVKTKADTLKGKVRQKLDNNNYMVAVNMGKPIFDWRKIPLSEDLDYKNLPIQLDGFDAPFAVSMGNPHMVFTTTKKLDTLNITRIATPLEYHPFFPDRVNVGFAEILDKNNINLRVYERGAGETLACGTGACAAAVACISRGLTNTSINVNTRGGKMKVEQNSSGEIVMSGPAQFEKDVTDSY